MRLPSEPGEGAAASLASPAVVVVLVLMLGATIYLWRARYLRGSTAYYAMTFLAIALIAAGALIYTSRV